MNMTKFFPEKKTSRFYLQAAISKELADEVNKHRKRQDLRWNTLVEALFKAYLAEMKKK